MPCRLAAGTRTRLTTMVRSEQDSRRRPAGPTRSGVRRGDGRSVHASETKPADLEGIRIARWLSRSGVASRRQAEVLIQEGRIRVNGRRCATPTTRVRAADRVELDGRLVRHAQPTRLWRYCKPVGVIVSRADPQGRRSLPEVLPPHLAGVMPVGRLDVTSEGLLLLTNDGALKRHLELPASRVLRVYLARVRGTPDDRALRALRAGLVVEGERFRPMGVALERSGGSNTWLRLELSEGRYREVRRALAQVGHPVGRLRRLAYGPVRLGALKPGEVEEVSPRVVRTLLATMLQQSRARREAQ